MAQSATPVKISSVHSTEDAVFILFDDGKEFIYPAAILHSAIPKDDVVSRRVQEALRRRAIPKTELVH